MHDQGAPTTLSREEAAQRLGDWVRSRVAGIDQHWDAHTLEWLANNPGADDRPPPMLLYELMLVLMDPSYTRWLTDNKDGLADQANAAESATLSTLIELTQRIRTRGITPGGNTTASQAASQPAHDPAD